MGRGNDCSGRGLIIWVIDSPQCEIFRCIHDFRCYNDCHLIHDCGGQYICNGNIGYEKEERNKEE